MAPRINKKEYVIFLLIIILFILSAGKYYGDRDAYKSLGDSWNFLTGSFHNQVYALTQDKKPNTKEFTLVFNSGTWNVFERSGRYANAKVGKNTETGTITLYLGDTNDNKFSVYVDDIGTYQGREGAVVLPIPYTHDVRGTFSVPEQEDYLPIFGYHNIVPDRDSIVTPTLDIALEDFEEQIRFATNELLCDWHTMGEIVTEYILKDIKLPENACVMSFDDGRANNFDVVYPILKKYDIPATFYVIAGRIGSSPAYMAWGEVDELYRNGHEIGGHGFSRGSLTQQLSDEELREETIGAKKILDKRGYKTTTFAYPLGKWNDRVVDAVVEAGFKAGRDISRPASWTDRRAVVTGTTQDYLWHLNYFKPEQATENDLFLSLRYTGWWQFEDGFKVLLPQHNQSVVVQSQAGATDTSYGVVSIDSGGVAIENKFLVREAGTYTVTIYAATTNKSLEDPFVNLEHVGVFVDGVRQILIPGTYSSCSTGENGWKYCDHAFDITLSPGSHSLISGAEQGTIKLDKYGMHRTFPQKIFYTLTLSYD